MEIGVVLPRVGIHLNDYKIDKEPGASNEGTRSFIQLLVRVECVLIGAGMIYRAGKLDSGISQKKTFHFYKALFECVRQYYNENIRIGPFPELLLASVPRTANH